MQAFSFIASNFRFLASGFLLTFNSSFGQTFFISIFAAHIMAGFNLTDGEWGLLYTISTSASAFVMFWAGATTDSFRVRQLAWFVIPGLALVCVGMALNTSVIGLAVLVFLLRFLGQGMMFQLSSVSMARWFQARRGLALSLASFGIMVGTAILPMMCAALLETLPWRRLWLFSGLFLAATLPLALWLLRAERTPQSFADDVQSAGMEGRQWTRREVIKSSLFLMLLPALLGPPMWGTALFFQQVHIAEVKGWGLVEYLALIPLLTLSSAIMTITAGQLIDKFGSGVLLRLYMIPWCVGFIILYLANDLFMAASALMVFGLAMGIQSTAITSFWAEYFGTRHIGSIKATSTSIMVFGSAIGPGITGSFIDWGYSFPDQMILLAAYFFIALVFVNAAVSRANQRSATSL